MRMAGSVTVVNISRGATESLCCQAHHVTVKLSKQATESVNECAPPAFDNHVSCVK